MKINKKKIELKFEKCCQNTKTSWQACDLVAKLIEKPQKSCYSYLEDLAKADSSIQAEELRTLALESQRHKTKKQNIELIVREYRVFSRRYRNRWIGEFLKEMMSAPILQLPCSSIRILCDLRRLTG